MTWLLVFVVSAVTDWLWAAYVRRVAAREPLQASLYASALVLCAAVATIAFVEDHVLVIPACLGGFVGTFLAVRRPLN